MTKLVVVGFVNTPTGKFAIEAAAGLAKDRHARLILVSSARGGSEDANAVSVNRDEFDRILHDLSARGIDVEGLEFARGNDPSTDILEVARERSADLIVVGLRRRSPVGKLLLGSNAQSILLSADCAVLAVKPPL